MQKPQGKKLELYSREYFGLCGVGGILSCGLTHMLVTPIDVVKCNAQGNPQKFNKGMIGNMFMWGREQGARALVRGWAPTLVGYSMQGLGKFGLYEIFKYKYAQYVGEKNAKEYKTLLYISASASAEFFADILLCPMETVKLKVQTQQGYGNGLMDGTRRLLSEEGVRGSFQILPTLWARQIPYTVIKFVAFERIIEYIYNWTDKNWGRPKESFNKAEQVGWTFVAGYAAGIICGAVSHPADTMATLLTKNPDANLGIFARIGKIYNGYGEKKGIGFKGLWKGFGPRVVMIGTLTGLQWFIYDSFKIYCGFPTTGGAPQTKK
jgi:solute carrier family 25 phosphate transporter 3